VRWAAPDVAVVQYEKSPFSKRRMRQLVQSRLRDAMLHIKHTQTHQQQSSETAANVSMLAVAAAAGASESAHGLAQGALPVGAAASADSVAAGSHLGALGAEMPLPDNALGSAAATVSPRSSERESGAGSGGGADSSAGVGGVAVDSSDGALSALLLGGYRVQKQAVAITAEEALEKRRRSARGDSDEQKRGGELDSAATAAATQRRQTRRARFMAETERSAYERSAAMVGPSSATRMQIRRAFRYAQRQTQQFDTNGNDGRKKAIQFRAS
jgi:hypothetical protein